MGASVVPTTAAPVVAALSSVETTGALAALIEDATSVSCVAIGASALSAAAPVLPIVPATGAIDARTGAGRSVMLFVSDVVLVTG